MFNGFGLDMHNAHEYMHGHAYIKCPSFYIDWAARRTLDLWQIYDYHTIIAWRSYDFSLQTTFHKIQTRFSCVKKIDSYYIFCGY